MAKPAPNVNPPRVGPVLAQVLRSGRDHWNSRFALARRQAGELDAAAFSDYLTTVVDPLVTRVNELAPDRVAPVAEVAYEVGLELTAQRLCGPGSRRPELQTSLSSLLPAYAALVASSPRQVIASLGNAVHHLATTPGASPQRFASELLTLAASIEDAAVLLSVGQVLAWRAGLAHYRAGALFRLASLPHGLARAVMQAPAEPGVPELLARLHADPWFDPSSSSRASATWVGAWAGFGGAFGEPPRVRSSNGQALIESGARHWILRADAFGATFHHATQSEIDNALPVSVDPEFSVMAGLLTRSNPSLTVPARGELTSSVEIAGAWVLGFSLTHSLLLLPNPQE